MNSEMYTAYRFFKNRKNPLVMKVNLTLDQARAFVESYLSTKNSFVGFKKNI